MKKQTSTASHVPHPPRCGTVTAPALLSQQLAQQSVHHDLLFRQEALAMEDSVRGDEYRFDSCRFDHIECPNAQFTGCEFLDCIFTACDLSGADLSSSRFFRCRFEGCRFIGAAFYESTWKDVVCDGCNFSYANFGSAHFERCAFTECLIKDGGFNLCHQKHLVFRSCDLQACSFANTSLADIHLESDRIDGITVSKRKPARRLPLSLTGDRPDRPAGDPCRRRAPVTVWSVFLIKAFNARCGVFFGYPTKKHPAPHRAECFSRILFAVVRQWANSSLTALDNVSTLVMISTIFVISAMDANS